MAPRGRTISSVNSYKIHKYVTRFSETHLKPHERFYILDYYLYRIDHHPERKGGIAFAVRKGISLK
jgi:hypothetical protein